MYGNTLFIPCYAVIFLQIRPSKRIHMGNCTDNGISNMSDETIKYTDKYTDKVEKLYITKDIDVRKKTTTKNVEVTSENLVVNGKKGHEPGQYVISPWSNWQLKIPLASIKNVFLHSFKAEGLMYFDKEAVGVEATVDGVLMNYAIFTKHPDDLCKAIEDSIPQ